MSLLSQAARASSSILAAAPEAPGTAARPGSRSRRRYAVAAGLAGAVLLAGCSPTPPDPAKQRGAWDVRVTSVGDPYTYAGAEETAGRRTVLVRFTATNVSERAQTFTTATTLALTDTDGGWFEQLPAPSWSGVTAADRADVPPDGATSGGVLFRVRDNVPAKKLRLVIGREMAIRPVGGLPPTAYTVELPVSP